jgi:hypothetical protein
VYRLGLEDGYPVPPPVGGAAMRDPLALHQGLDALPTQLSTPPLSSPRGWSQTFSVSAAADERSGHLLFEDAGPYLRETLGIPPYQDVNLWVLPDPPEGEKPKEPYPILIKLAIYGSPDKQLTLQEIYTTLEERFQWFREHRNERPWKVGFRRCCLHTATDVCAQNSIRHNLSLNKVFKGVSRAITEPGKGYYWQLDCSSGEGYKRARKRRSKSARAAFGQGDNDFSEGDVEDRSVAVGLSHRKSSKSRSIRRLSH